MNHFKSFEQLPMSEHSFKNYYWFYKYKDLTQQWVIYTLQIKAQLHLIKQNYRDCSLFQK